MIIIIGFKSANPAYKQKQVQQRLTRYQQCYYHKPHYKHQSAAYIYPNAGIEISGIILQYQDIVFFQTFNAR